LRHHIGERHAFRLGVYENEIEDLIEFVPLAVDPFGELRNVAESAHPGRRSRLRHIQANSGRSMPSSRSPIRKNRSTGGQLPRRAKESFTLALQRRFERFDFGVNLLAAGERTDVGFPDPVELDGYVLVDLTAGLRITDRLSLRARVENLLDEDYELADGFNTPERGVYVALRYGQSR
jgi:vitamin B12 transporter